MEKKHKKVQVAIAAIDREEQEWFLLILKTNQKRGEFWQNVTGSVEDNETFEEAALREAQEETGLEIEFIQDMVDLKKVFFFKDNRARQVEEHSFLIIADIVWPPKLDPHEHDDFRWVPLKGIKEDSVKYEGNYEVLELAIQLLKRQGRMV